MTNRPIHEIANEIRKYWHPVNFAAKPYLDAMLTLNTTDDKYGLDSGKSIVLYFLGNAATFRGEHAKRIKNELKQILKKS